jgi:hypothetical protein
MKISMTGQEKSDCYTSDCLIEMTAWEGSTVYMLVLGQLSWTCLSIAETLIYIDIAPWILLQLYFVIFYLILICVLSICDLTWIKSFRELDWNVMLYVRQSCFNNVTKKMSYKFKKLRPFLKSLGQWPKDCPNLQPCNIQANLY